MIYAAKIDKPDNAITVGANDGKILNVVHAFRGKADFKKAVDMAWREGANYVRLSRKEVEKHFGREFSMSASGIVCAHEWTAQRLDEAEDK